jgi:PAS domain S-box-containing protein
LWRDFSVAVADDRNRTIDELAAELKALREKVSALEALRRGEGPGDRFTLEALMEQIPIVVIIADADLTVRMVSRYGQDLIGYPPQTLENISYEEHVRRWKLLRPDGTRPGMEDLPLMRAIKGGEVVKNEEFTVESADGGKLDILCSAGPIRDAAGKVMGGAVVIRDITERKRDLEELRELNAELRDALNKVNVLSGLLPVCASCKRIKDSAGNWNSMERYISERSNAEFTHSICPDCAKKLYPELSGKK